MKKPRGRSGFTMVEMLCAVLVLLLASLAMVAEISFASRTYKDSMDVSQGQMLCSTLTTAVSEELRGAKKISGTGAGLKFISDNYGIDCSFGTDENGRVTLGGISLLSGAAYPGGITASVAGLTYEDGIFTATVSVRSNDGSALADRTFSVKPLSPDD